MIPLGLDMLRDLVPGEWERAVWASEATGVEVDSRRIEEGDLFVAVASGSDFVAHALARGAAAALVPDEPHGALAAIELALLDAHPDEIVVIAGRGAEPEQELATGKVPFDDRDVARSILGRVAAQQ